MFVRLVINVSWFLLFNLTKLIFASSTEQQAPPSD